MDRNGLTEQPYDNFHWEVNKMTEIEWLKTEEFAPVVAAIQAGMYEIAEIRLLKDEKEHCDTAEHYTLVENKAFEQACKKCWIKIARGKNSEDALRRNVYDLLFKRAARDNKC